MSRTLENEIRGALSSAALSAGVCLPAAAFRIPARGADAGARLPDGATLSREPEAVLFGAPLVKRTRVTGGWLLVDFSGAFYDALALQALETIPAVQDAAQEHAVNRMLVLSRHGGSGCPRVVSLQRALLLCTLAHQGGAACARAERAAETMLHAVPPRERPALIETCGALGGACAKLLSSAKRGPSRAEQA